MLILIITFIASLGSTSAYNPMCGGFPEEHATIEYDSNARFAEISCEEGYRLQGSSRYRHCAFIEWEGPFPACIRGDQVPTKQQALAQMRYPGQLSWQINWPDVICAFDNFGCSHECVYSNGNVNCFCPYGFQLDSDSKSCIANPIDCPRIIDTEDSKVVYNGKMAAAQYSCKGAYVGWQGHGYLRCNRGKWEGDIPTCMSVEMWNYLTSKPTCPELDPPVNGKKQCSLATSDGLTTIRCKFGCTADYRLRGSLFRWCQPNGSWNGTEASCVREKDCATPAPVQHGSILNCSPDSRPIVNQRCIFQCNLGFTLRGPEYVVCSSNGTLYNNHWKEVKPICVDIDECSDEQLNWCSHTCHNTRGSYKCSCPPGYALINDHMCEDVHECEAHKFVRSHVCENSEKSANCTCPIGFHLDRDNKTCIDVDECEVHNFGCSHVCVNIPGGAYCSCPIGFDLDRDNKTCIDMDECEVDNFGCSHVCVNTQGSAHCSCPIGFHLDPSNKTCIDVDECEVDNFGCSHECMNTQGSAFCLCRPGFHLEKDKKCIANPPLCPRIRATEHVRVQYRLSGMLAEFSCDSGYDLKGERFLHCSNKTWKEPFPKCISNACPRITAPEHAKIEYHRNGTVAEFFCEEGYRLDGKRFQGCSTRHWAQPFPKCISNDECKVNTIGCSHVCMNTQGRTYCLCHKGFILDQDNKTCTDVDECEVDNFGCSHVCVNTQGSANCSCPVGFFLYRDNKTCIDVDECEVDNFGCSDVCVNTPGSAFCFCPVDFHLDRDNKTCIANSRICRRIMDSEHVTISYYGNEAIAQFSCEEAFNRLHEITKPKRYLRCSNGTWEGSIPACMSDEMWIYLTSNLICPELRPPVYGTRQCSRTALGKFTTLRCNFACKRKYYLVGSRSRWCHPDGSWNGTEGICLSKEEFWDYDVSHVHCPGLFAPINGKMECSLIKSDGATNIRCKFSCIEDYQLRGTSIRWCQPDHLWNGTDARCVPEACPRIAAGKHVTIMYDRSGRIANISCVRGYRLQGTRLQKCRNKTWGAPIPQCIRIVPPVIDSQFFPESMVVDKGSRITLVCIVISGDRPLRIRWLKNGFRFLAQGDRNVKTKNDISILTFNRVIPADKGLYSCVATNEVSSANMTTRLIINAIRCPAVAVPLHTIVSYNEPDNQGTNWNSGSKIDSLQSEMSFYALDTICNFECKSGYYSSVLPGAIKCQRDGTWNGTIPECI